MRWGASDQACKTLHPISFIDTMFFYLNDTIQAQEILWPPVFINDFIYWKRWNHDHYIGRARVWNHNILHDHVVYAPKPLRCRENFPLEVKDTLSNEHMLHPLPSTLAFVHLCSQNVEQFSRLPLKISRYMSTRVFRLQKLFVFHFIL